jgi:hypothetical protein
MKPLHRRMRAVRQLPTVESSENGLQLPGPFHEDRTNRRHRRKWFARTLFDIVMDHFQLLKYERSFVYGAAALCLCLEMYCG